MSLHKTFTDIEILGLKLHGLETTEPSQLSDSFILGFRWERVNHNKKIRELENRLSKAEKEIEQWKANHANQIEAAKFLKEREDLPLERISAYSRHLDALDKLDRITRILRS